jgi:hypothetical protein
VNFTAEQRAAIRAEYSDHFFCRVVKNGAEHLLALPKKHAERVAFAGRLDLTVDMLHGATIRLNTVRGEA